MTKGKKTQGEKEVKTVWICKGCPGEPGLCVNKGEQIDNEIDANSPSEQEAN